jgi:hypothetical protein
MDCKICNHPMIYTELNKTTEDFNVIYKEYFKGVLFRYFQSWDYNVNYIIPARAN